MAFLHVKMVVNTVVCGVMVCNMVLGNLLIAKESKKKGYGTKGDF